MRVPDFSTIPQPPSISERWYVLFGFLVAGTTLASLGFRHIKRLSQWLWSQLMSGTINPVTTRVKEVDHRVDEASGRLARVEDSLDAITRMVEEVLHEMRPNSGSSIKDAINRLDPAVATIVQRQKQMADDVDELKEAVAEHRGFHDGLDRHHDH